MKNPEIKNYYLTKSIEDKWGVIYWDGKKWWDDPNQDGQLSFGIKEEWIKEWYNLPENKKNNLELFNNFYRNLKSILNTGDVNICPNCDNITEFIPNPMYHHECKSCKWTGDLNKLKTKSVKSFINELTNEYIEKLNNL